MKSRTNKYKYNLPSALVAWEGLSPVFTHQHACWGCIKGIRM